MIIPCEVAVKSVVPAVKALMAQTLGACAFERFDIDVGNVEEPAR